ncbi:hypothetical protein HanHA300_Chr03g0104891 [Helianthus annuus]|nr:hypothetical protein HanHA300_Chr03g0104891 [Helianthus annuus]
MGLGCCLQQPSLAENQKVVVTTKIQNQPTNIIGNYIRMTSKWATSYVATSLSNSRYLHSIFLPFVNFGN